MEHNANMGLNGEGAGGNGMKLYWQFLVPAQPVQRVNNNNENTANRRESPTNNNLIHPCSPSRSPVHPQISQSMALRLAGNSLTVCLRFKFSFEQ